MVTVEMVLKFVSFMFCCYEHKVDSLRASNKFLTAFRSTQLEQYRIKTNFCEYPASYDKI